MRGISATLNVIIAVLSLVFFAYTFVAEEHLGDLAKSFVTEKTLGYSEPVVSAAEQGLESPLAEKLVSAEMRKDVRDEVELYRSDPLAYVESLTDSESFAEDLDRKLGKSASIKGKIRDYYYSTLSDLIVDLRIFSGSNVVFSGVALFLIFHGRFGRDPQVLWLTFLVFAAVLFNSYMYIDGLSFFTILFKAHLGWWYPLFVLGSIVWLYFKTGRIGKQA